MTLGPALGGLLSEPETHYPSLFSSIGLFARLEQHPMIFHSTKGRGREGTHFIVPVLEVMGLLWQGAFHTRYRAVESLTVIHHSEFDRVGACFLLSAIFLTGIIYIFGVHLVLVAI